MKRLASLLFLSCFMLAAIAEERETLTSDLSDLDVDRDFVYNLDQMPTAGGLSENGLAWPEYFWASTEGIIANRWQISGSNNFEYRSPSLQSLRSMSQTQIDKLSPAEKYDILLSRYDYPTVKMSRERGGPRARDWNGICHGIAPASIHHAEPATVELTNADGIKVTFYSSDVKGLLGFYYAFFADEDPNHAQVGKRCFFRARAPFVRRSDACTDVNPASMHLAVTNMLGIKKKGLLADVDPYKEVWNHALTSYRATYLAQAAGRRGTRKVKVRMILKYAGGVEASREPIIGTLNAKYEELDMTYWLDLNSRGEVVGGEWIDGVHPDFLWYRGAARFQGHFARIMDIYRPAR